VREGFDPLALSHGAAVRCPCFSRFSARARRRGCERVLPLSRSPVGLGFVAPVSLVSPHVLVAGVREGFDPLALSRGAGTRCPGFFCFFSRARRRDARGFRPSRALPWGWGLPLPASFVSPHVFAAGGVRGFRPSRALPWDWDSQLSTSFAFSRVSLYSSGTRTVSDWGGTVTAADSFFGCAESRFAERKSVWVTASGSVTRMSRSEERLYTR